jgi:PII-like signaling protein
LYHKREAKLIRIFFGESDQYKGKPLYKHLLEFLRNEGISGATVLRGISGYGTNSIIHTTSIIRLSTDLPLVVEIVDTPETIDALLPKLVEYMDYGGIITEENIRIVEKDE